MPGSFRRPRSCRSPSVSRTGIITLSVEFFLDTGADRTVVPLTAAVGVGFDPATAETRRSVAPDGVVTPRPVGTFDLTVLGRRVSCICFVIHTGVGLLGRDVLQHFRITLDGPASTLTVEDDAPGGRMPAPARTEPTAP